MHYVYILQSISDKKLYIGFTDNLINRFKQHNAYKSFATKPRAPFRMIYYEAYVSKEDAMNREKMLKQFGQGYRRIKERIVNSLKTS